MMKFSSRCVLFDLDGTLIDTNPDLSYAANQVRAELGLEPLPEESYRPSASNGARGMLRVALGISMDDPRYLERKNRFLHHYRDHLSHSSRLFPGVSEVLERLDDNMLPWGIVTNKAGWLTEPLVAALGLSERAAVVVSGDTTPNPKPAPDSLLYAAEALSLSPSHCMYIGDDKRDIDAGRAAGMTTVVAAWGYLGAHSPDPGMWQPDKIVATPTELLELLELPRERVVSEPVVRRSA